LCLARKGESRRRHTDGFGARATQVPRELAALLNMLLVLEPSELIAVKHTIMTRASITAYSTAVGPSSEARKRRILCIGFILPLFGNDKIVTR
jgi:hypothetical protein